MGNVMSNFTVSLTGVFFITMFEQKDGAGLPMLALREMNKPIDLPKLAVGLMQKEQSCRLPGNQVAAPQQVQGQLHQPQQRLPGAPPPHTELFVCFIA